MAAADVQSKKRKGATDSQPKAKKARKSDDIASAKATLKEAAGRFSDDETSKPKKSKKSKALEPTDVVAVQETIVVSEKPTKKAKKNKEPAAADAVVPEIDVKTTKKSKKGKKAVEAEIAVTEEDIQDALAGAEEEKPKKEKKSKKSKKADVVEEPAAEPVVEALTVVVEEKKAKKGKKSKKQEEAPVVEVEEASVVAGDNDAEDEDALDDQTAALLAGFESDRDESDLEKEDEEFDEDALAETGKEISKKKRKDLEKARKDAEPGVIYLGRIPHGFFEPQMKKYFSQFGTVLRLRLSRNKKTGASKHYAFIEFANGEVADIVAKTMHNYLMFGHILQCRLVPSEQVHPELFKGANERFKVDPRNQKERAALARGATRDVWEKRVQRENKRRAGKSKALLEEFDYEFNAPPVKPVDSVPKKTAAIEDGPAQALLTQGEADAEPETDVVAAEETPEKKTKKTKEKKRKSDVVPVNAEESEVAVPKSKKTKKESQAQSEVVADKKRKVSQNGTSTKKAKKAKA